MAKLTYTQAKAVAIEVESRIKKEIEREIVQRQKAYDKDPIVKQIVQLVKREKALQNQIREALNTLKKRHNIDEYVRDYEVDRFKIKAIVSNNIRSAITHSLTLLTVGTQQEFDLEKLVKMMIEKHKPKV